MYCIVDCSPRGFDTWYYIYFTLFKNRGQILVVVVIILLRIHIHLGLFIICLERAVFLVMYTLQSFIFFLFFLQVSEILVFFTGILSSNGSTAVMSQTQIKKCILFPYTKKHVSCLACRSHTSFCRCYMSLLFSLLGNGLFRQTHLLKDPYTGIINSNMSR